MDSFDLINILIFNPNKTGTPDADRLLRPIGRNFATEDLGLLS
jgi:hypothetical protein